MGQHRWRARIFACSWPFCREFCLGLGDVDVTGGVADAWMSICGQCFVLESRRWR